MNRPAIFLDTRPLQTGHAMRGIGAYTTQLREELQKMTTIRVVQSEEEADLVHYPFFDFFFDTLPLFSPKPRVVTIHDVIPLQFPEQYQPGLVGSIRFQKQKLALRTIQYVITDSYASGQAITQYLGVPNHRVAPIYLAANPALFAPTTTQLRKVKEKYELPEEYVLYVGDINYNKNLPSLIKSIALLPKKVQLVCVGKNFFPQPIPEWQAIETACKEAGVAERVHFLTEVRAVDMTELSALYHGAVAHIQPSLSEGFGLPVLEAMRCKVPSIVAKNSSLIEVGGEYAVFIDPTPERIAQAVIQLRGWNESKRKEWIELAFNWQSTFTWQKTAEETAIIYRRVLGML